MKRVLFMVVLAGVAWSLPAKAQNMDSSQIQSSGVLESTSMQAGQIQGGGVIESSSMHAGQIQAYAVLEAVPLGRSHSIIFGSRRPDEGSQQMAMTGN